MRTLPNIRPGAFKDSEQREEIKKLADHMRQTSGALSRSVFPGQTPAANPIPSGSPPPPGQATPTPTQGDLLYGLASGSWAKLAIGAEDAVLIVSGVTPAWLGTANQLGYSIEWRANGLYLVDTVVDGGAIAPTDMTVSAVWLYRLIAGTSGSTVIDLNKNGTTMYTTQANRPTIAFNDADSKIQAALPDVTAVAAGDILSIDIDTVEAGSPGNLVLVVKGV